MPDLQRTHTGGQLRKGDAGSEATLSGWVDTRRDHGGVIFIDLRDRYGKTQVVFNPEHKSSSTRNTIQKLINKHQPSDQNML